MAMILEKGKMKEIGNMFGLSSQGVSQILSGKRRTSVFLRPVKAAAYEAGGCERMEHYTETEADGNILTICAWNSGVVKLVHSEKSNTVYKYEAGQQVNSWQGMSIPEFVQEQKKCERLAAVNY